ncbi:MAG: hypothetical protein WBP87_02800 [Candidatus Sulfotelmatobacter sp.]
MAETISTRRSKWQPLAAKKYPRLHFLGGDGSDSECWVVLTKCPHQQTPRWRYMLAASREAAEAILAGWTIRCAYTCEGSQNHSLWKMEGSTDAPARVSNYRRNASLHRWMTAED